jgi:hypothetical protein
MKLKYCSKCKKEKELSEFGKRTNTKDKLHVWCKICIKEDTIIRKKYRKEYNNKNQEKIINYSKKHYIENFEKINNYNKNYYIKNKDYYLEYNKNYNLINKDKINDYNKKTLFYRKEWAKHQYKTNIQYKLGQLLRIRFLDAIKGKINKSVSTLELLGCSIDELKIHLENQFKEGMTWENHGIIWEIDHIKSCASFDLTKLEEQQKCFHYTNLQPLTIFENRQKKNK